MTTAFSDTTGGKIFNFIIGREKKKHSHGDASREVFETVVFVVVLVLMLKLFVAEAFVIPTGSMASTLWGDQVKVTCPECGEVFPVSASPREGVRAAPSQATCQNCGYTFTIKNAADSNSGDRVLVAKYEYHIRPPKRFDVPVFRFPEYPYSKAELSAMNYIKRLVGLPGETIAIYKGDLYRTTTLTYSGRSAQVDPKDLWRLRWPKKLDENELGRENPRDGTWYSPLRDYTFTNDPEAVALFEANGFDPIRKDPDEILAVRRLVFDFDKQPASLSGINRTRWHPQMGANDGWTDATGGFKHDGQASGWLVYHHVDPGWETAGAQIRQPSEITDHLAYNSGQRGNFWVPDLIVECKAEFAADTDKLTLELNKGGDRFQAVFDAGVCRLYRIALSSPTTPTLLAEQKTGIKSGRYSLRFANVDSRLTVWVDDRPLKFGPTADYPPPSHTHFEKTDYDKNEPARIGATGNVTVSKIQLWRDIYYTPGDYQTGDVETHYVQPGHYWCLGDNSASSSDGRTWGLVPERLMLGRAVVVYWPPSRIGVIK
ncbi:MAG TPA: S26 family signal peptidase [Gemmataceae bacterium]|jgi:signal peptidase I|nr:S26 family signal peptidase [Gemmataceae bacterium]